MASSPNSPEFDLAVRVKRLVKLMEAETALIRAYPAGYWLEFGNPDSDRYEHDDAYQARAALKRAIAATSLDITTRTGKPAALILAQRAPHAFGTQ